MKIRYECIASHEKWENIRDVARMSVYQGEYLLVDLGGMDFLTTTIMGVLVDLHGIGGDNLLLDAPDWVKEALVEILPSVRFQDRAKVESNLRLSIALRAS